jgi:hypothetical protein
LTQQRGAGNLGNKTRIRECSSESHRRDWLDDLIKDVSYGLRQARHNRRFTAVVIEDNFTPEIKPDLNFYAARPPPPNHLTRAVAGLTL